MIKARETGNASHQLLRCVKSKTSTFANFTMLCSPLSTRIPSPLSSHFTLNKLMSVSKGGDNIGFLHFLGTWTIQIILMSEVKLKVKRTYKSQILWHNAGQPMSPLYTKYYHT